MSGAERTGLTRDGDLLWVPTPAQIAETNLAAFTGWLHRERGLRFGSYDELWRWSTTDLAGFWQAVWDRFGVRSSAPPSRVLTSTGQPGADYQPGRDQYFSGRQWFPGARLNYAEHVLRSARPGHDALLYRSEQTPLAGLPWETLAGQVRVLATRLRELGVRPGDRVASCLPNIPQAVIAMLATTSIGAIWSSCSPDFGWRGVIDRFSQLAPRVLFCADGYRYAGRDFPRTSQLGQIIDALDSLQHVIYLPYLEPDREQPPVPWAVSWAATLDRPPVPAQEFRFEQVPFDHPLWILFSSGTTGLPKPIVHGHGGILLEQLKLQHLHLDLRAGDRLFFFTTTGWMMWNFLVSSLLLGVCPVLFDGSPAHPEPDVLWQVAQDAGVRLFGASPAYVELMTRSGIVPAERFRLPELRAVMLAGSPVSAACGAWFYRNVRPDLWLCSGSGGTDVCTGLVGGLPTQPVYAGEIQARHLGVAAYAFNEHGQPVTDQVGELVITAPMPSMPVGFWGDHDDCRYRAAYFADFPGAWRQGDFFRINARGGCFVLGRSDATLNRHGVRIGTAEIYTVLASVPEIEDALIVNLDLPDGGFFMPLFVTLTGGQVLDDALREKVCARLRAEYTPRHVPDRIIQVGAIPVTLTGKKMEVPVRRILLGLPPDAAANVNAMANPAALEEFIGYARTQQDYPLAGR